MKHFFQAHSKWHHNKCRLEVCTYTAICPRSSDPVYIVRYYIRWFTTSWTYSTYTSVPPHSAFFLVSHQWIFFVIIQNHSHQLLILCVLLSRLTYRISKKACPIFIVYWLYKKEQDFLDRQYFIFFNTTKILFS